MLCGEMQFLLSKWVYHMQEHGTIIPLQSLLGEQRKESSPSVCNWRLGLGEYTYQNADQKGFSEKKKHPLQEGHTSLATRFVVFFLLKTWK